MLHFEALMPSTVPSITLRGATAELLCFFSLADVDKACRNRIQAHETGIENASIDLSCMHSDVTLKTGLKIVLNAQERRAAPTNSPVVFG